MRGLPKRCYTLDFKQAAIDACTRQSIGRTARELGVPDQTLRNWIKSQRQQSFLAAACSVNSEQMELARLTAATARHIRYMRMVRLVRLTPPNTSISAS